MASEHFISDRTSLRLDYMGVFKHALVQPLLSKGQDGIEEVGVGRCSTPASLVWLLSSIACASLLDAAAASNPLGIPRQPPLTLPGAPQTLDLMHEYCLVRDDLDFLSDVTSWKTKAPWNEDLFKARAMRGFEAGGKSGALPCL